MYLFVSLLFTLSISYSPLLYKDYLESPDLKDNPCSRQFKHLVYQKAFQRNSVYFLSCDIPGEEKLVVEEMSRLGWNVSIHHVAVLESIKSQVFTPSEIPCCKIVKTDHIDDSLARYKSVLHLEKDLNRPEISDSMYMPAQRGLFGIYQCGRVWGLDLQIIMVDMR